MKRAHTRVRVYPPLHFNFWDTPDTIAEEMALRRWTETLMRVTGGESLEEMIANAPAETDLGALFARLAATMEDTV